MVKLYNITEWSEQLWWNTGGTRDKKIYVNPIDGELYYFKQSYRKGLRDYKYEFWSEIIASEIGELLGFNILAYHIAIRGEVVGCISKSMINQASEELVEGGKYLHAFDSTFNPEDTKLRSQYNFNLIVNALTSFKKEKHIKELLEVLVFDALIGNSDRHQENWAIINNHTVITEGIVQIERDIKTGKIDNAPEWLTKIIKKVYTVSGKIRPELETARLTLPKKTKFAPIYDSGCSFGREMSDERVALLLTNEQAILKYITNGLAEIHWGVSKINHFELIEKLLQTNVIKDDVLSTLDRVFNFFDPDKIKNIVSTVDQELIDLGNPNILPIERKELILKLLFLRSNKLREIYSQYK